MSPILVRPVREQFEHDRVIRVLQARYKRKYEVVINPGAEQNASVEVGDLAMYPDLVLFSQERSRKMQGTVEVETVESINTLEAMAEWGPFSRLRAAFFLYVPANSIDTVRRLCAEYSISPAEIWTYHVAIDQVRFTMVHRSPDAPRIPEPRAERISPGAEAMPKREKAVKADRDQKPEAARVAPEKLISADRKADKAKSEGVKAEKPTTHKAKAEKPKADKAPTEKARATTKAAPRKAAPVKAKAKTAPAAAKKTVKKAAKPAAKKRR